MKEKKTKRRTSNKIVHEAKVAAQVAEDGETAEEDTPPPPPPPVSKSKCKARPKSRPKSAAKLKSAMKRPKSRSSVISKEKHQATTYREQVMAVLEAMNAATTSYSKTKSSKSRTRVKERSVSNEVMVSSSKAKTYNKNTKGQKMVLKESECKSKSKTKRKSRPKSLGLACKSSKSTRKPVTPQAAKSSTKVSTSQVALPASSNTTQIIMIGSDPKALELLKSLLQKMNQPKEAAEEKQHPIEETPKQSADIAEELVTDQALLEELYDAMYELGNNVRTIQDSYEKIINSLVNLQHRRKGPKEKMTLIPSASKTKTESAHVTTAPPAVNAAPGNIDRFMSPATRNEAFSELFGQVDALKESMASFYACFDDGGFFNQDLYTERRISVAQRNSWLAQIRSLAATVDALLAEYNKEVLDMFRISAVESNIGKE